MAEVESKGRQRKSIGSWLAGLTGYLLLAVCSFVASVSILCCGFAMTEDFYGTSTAQDVLTIVGEDACENAADMLWTYINNMDTEGALRYFSTRNIDAGVLYATAAPAGRERTRDVIFSTYNGSYEPSVTKDIRIKADDNLRWITSEGKYKYILKGSEYIIRVYIDSTFPYHDSLRMLSKMTEVIYEMRYVFIWTAFAGGVATILCFIFLMHHAGYDHRSTSIPTKKERGIYLDLILVFGLLGLAGILWGSVRAVSVLSTRDFVLELMAAAFFIMTAVIWVTLCCYNIAYQLKFGKWWKHTLICTAISLGFRLVKYIVKVFVQFIKGIPLVMTTMILYLVICVVEYFGGFFFLKKGLDMLWLIDKIILFPIVVYVAVCCKRFLAASKALAGGELDHTVNTSGMIGEMKKHGENLNSIGLGITKAVEERTKSERMKTELITNVSHDLKTPLTSIINYSRLISEQKTENKEIEEYSQVLFRQSERLKKLLEDLLEVSKATTGNLEVNLVPCEVGVILSQAVGEYQRRLEEKELELHITQPEEPVRIIADGRHLWRVFDNLLNNVYKYAQEKSRVYLNVEQQEGQVLIIFRNMSKYALSVSAE